MGRHKYARKTFEEMERDWARIYSVLELWDRLYQDARARGMKDRAARAEAAAGVCATTGLGVRSLQKLRKKHVIDAESRRRGLEEALARDRPHRDLRRAAWAILTDEEADAIRDMPHSVGMRLIERLVAGARAEAENSKLRAQLTAWKGISLNSANPKTR